MEEKVLPLGSVVYLKNLKDKIMVICRGAIYGEKEEEYYDYLGCLYPSGLEREKAIFFNEENIESVIFEGYTDDNEERLSQIYLKWRKETDIPKGKG